MCSQEDTVSGDIKVQLSRSEEERRKLEKECAIYLSQLEVRTCLCVYVVIRINCIAHVHTYVFMCICSNTHKLYSTCTYVCLVHNIEMVCTMLDFRDISSHNSTNSCLYWLVSGYTSVVSKCSLYH